MHDDARWFLQQPVLRYWNCPEFYSTKRCVFDNLTQFGNLFGPNNLDILGETPSNRFPYDLIRALIESNPGSEEFFCFACGHMLPTLNDQASCWVCLEIARFNLNGFTKENQEIVYLMSWEDVSVAAFK